MDPLQYRYDALSDIQEHAVAGRRTRIIHLLPSLSHKDTIRINIQTVSLDESPKYEALSYVWGPQVPSTKVWIDDRYLEVGPGLQSALVYLRYSDIARTLWIDRISINQDSIPEREQQVALMGGIYSTASMVIAWLGDATADSDLAFKTIRAIMNEVLRPAREAGRKYQEEDWESAKPVFDGLRLESAEAIAIRSLLGRPWFGRVWTFQEIVLASSARLQCGTEMLPWHAMMFFLEGCRKWRSGPNIEDNVLDGHDRNVMLMSYAHAASLKGTEFTAAARMGSMSLMTLMHGSRNYGATDPRDRVYAFLNVAIDMKQDVFPVSYTMSIMDVFATATKWVIKTHRKLGILAVVETKDALPLVSWVPDFRSQDPMNFWRQLGTIDRGAEHSIYQASGATVVELKDEALSNLTVRGIRIGVITQRTEPSGNINPPNTVFGTHVQHGGSWQVLARNAFPNGEYTPTKEGIDYAFDRIRIADIFPGEELNRRKREKPFKPLPKLVPEKFSYVQVKGMGNFKGPRDDIGTRIITATFRRRMFLTDSGYLGLGHRSLQVGDEVFIIFGADTPFVLRKVNGNAYILRGDAYVHGAMDGEVLELANATESPFKAMELVLF